MKLRRGRYEVKSSTASRSLLDLLRLHLEVKAEERLRGEGNRRIDFSTHPVPSENKDTRVVFLETLPHGGENMHSLSCGALINSTFSGVFSQITSISHVASSPLSITSSSSSDSFL